EVDGVTGKVVRVGFRSTRIKTTDTAFMTIPNKTIVNNKLSNLTRRTSRRIQFNLGLTYQTGQTQIQKIIEEIRNYGNNHPKKNDEINVGLFNFSSYAIEIYVEFYFEYEVWEKYILTRDEVMFRIMEIVKNNNAEFAYQVQFMNIEKK
ncbi:MAG: mechanosensitive ion channel family protein, partial [Chitinophagales bacterium]